MLRPPSASQNVKLIPFVPPVMNAVMPATVLRERPDMIMRRAFVFLARPHLRVGSML